MKEKYFGRILGKRVYWKGLGEPTKRKTCIICYKDLRRGADKRYVFHLPVCIPCRVKSLEESRYHER